MNTLPPTRMRIRSALQSVSAPISHGYASAPRWATASARALHSSSRRLEEASAAPGSEDVRTNLKSALKTAMKARDKPMTATIKSALSDITYQEKSSAQPNEPADNGTVIEVMRKTVEKRRQAAEAYPEGDPARTDLLREVDLLSSFLPRTLDAETIHSRLQSIVSALSADERQNRSATGTVLAEFWKQTDKSEVADKKSLGKMIAEMLKTS